MSKLSLSLVVSILRMVIAGLSGAISLARKIADVIDNAKLDGSYVPPTWLLNVQSGLEYAERALTCFDLADSFASRDHEAAE